MNGGPLAMLLSSFFAASALNEGRFFAIVASDSDASISLRGQVVIQSPMHF